MDKVEKWKYELDGSSIALGGCVTLNQLDIINTFRGNKYKLFDKYKDVSFTETVEIMRQSLLTDYLVTSVNKILENLEESHKGIQEFAILNAKRIKHKSSYAITGSCSKSYVKDSCNFTHIIHNGRKFEDRFTILVVPDILVY